MQAFLYYHRPQVFQISDKSNGRLTKYARLLVNAGTLEKIKQGATPEEIEQSWQKNLTEFKARRASFLLYK